MQGLKEIANIEKKILKKKNSQKKRTGDDVPKEVATYQNSSNQSVDSYMSARILIEYESVEAKKDIPEEEDLEEDESHSF